MRQHPRTVVRVLTVAAGAVLMLGVTACGSQPAGSPAGAPSAGPAAGTTSSSTVAGSAGSSGSDAATGSATGPAGASPGGAASGAATGSPGASSSGSTTVAPPSTGFTAPSIPSGAGSPPAGVPVVPAPGAATGRATELTGTVEAGVEAGCLVLTGPGGAVLANLMGLDTVAAPVGTQVVVTGTFRKDLMTTCQQGRPFQVAAVTKR